jgi:hypothetical protein
MSRFPGREHLDSMRMKESKMKNQRHLEPPR